MSKESVYLDRLLSLWNESREEIRQRIRQRDLYVIQMMIAVAGVLVASRLMKQETSDLAWLWLTLPLPFFYYSIMSYHSYLIHKQLARYMSDSLEPKIMDVISKESETYLEYEQFFKTENSVGVRSWLFMNIPTGIALLVMIYSVLISFVGQLHWFLVWPAFSVLICYALNLWLPGFELSWEEIKNGRDRESLWMVGIVALISLFILMAVFGSDTKRLVIIDFYFFENIYYFFFPFIFSAWYLSMKDVERKMNTNNNKKLTRVNFIGFGEVVKTKYLPLLSDLDGFGEYKVLDLDKEVTWGESHVEACSRIVRAIKDKPDVWVVATPSSTHYDYYCLMKQMNCICAIEKPATIDLYKYKKMRSDSFGKDNSPDWFPMAYYLLEKGFPLLYLLSEEVSESDGYSGLVEVTDVAPDWISKNGCAVKMLREALGQVKEFRGLILEGGSSNALHQRFWVLENGGGGNTWETLFHLATMVCIAKSFNSKVSGKDFSLSVESRVFHKFDLGGRKVFGDIGSYVSLKVPEGEWMIGTSKMIDAGLNSRGVEIVTENDFVISMDFENCELKVVKDNHVQLRIKNKLLRKYELQMTLLRRWLNSEDRQMYLPMKIYDEAMKLMESITLKDGKPIEPQDKPELNGADKGKLIKSGWNKNIFF